jgi:hypothetical protein
MFRGPGFQPIFAQPMGGLGFSPNPYANMIGASPLTMSPFAPGPLGVNFGGIGPLATDFNSGIFPNGGVGLGFSNGAFPGVGTAINPGFDPRFGNQGAILNGQIPGNFNASISNQSALNPFISPNGGFVNPNTGMFEPFANGASNFNGQVVNGNFPQGTVFDSGTGTLITPGGAVVQNNPANGSTIVGPTVDAQVIPQNGQGMVSASIENGRLVLRYLGDTSIVRSITFSLLDANRRPIRLQIINRDPPEARMTLTNRTEFYRVNIEFLDGRNQVVEGAV